MDVPTSRELLVGETWADSIEVRGTESCHECHLPSWIVELRARLENPPPVSVEVEESRAAAVLVPLYVDAGHTARVLENLLFRLGIELPVGEE